MVTFTLALASGTGLLVLACFAARILRATAIPVLALNVLPACYRYVPATTTEVVVGGAYRGYLTTEGSQNVARLVGENVELFDGTIITVTDTVVSGRP